VNYETSRSVQKSCTFFKIFGILALSSKSLRLPLFAQNLCTSCDLLNICALLALLALCSQSLNFLRFAQNLCASRAFVKIFALVTLSSTLLHFAGNLCASHATVSLTLSLAAIKKCIEWRLQVQIAFSTEVDLAPSRPE
jgi:hypothetical protein